MDAPKGEAFRKRMPPAAKRHVFIRRSILWQNLEAPVNPERCQIDDAAEVTRSLKDLALGMGADLVGVAEFDPRFNFSDAGDRGHRFVMVIAKAMKYDVMIDIGPNSQDEVHRVYYRLDDIAVRLTHHIGAYGYSARGQLNSGDFPLPAYGYLAGLGELGKHGSLISPQLGSSFRLSALSTDMPLVADGPRDHGIGEICLSCNVCERFCPGDAIKPDKREVSGVVRWHVDTPACEPWFFRLHGCKLCLMVCPFNARGALKEQFKPVARDIREAGDATGLIELIEKRTGVRYSEVEIPFVKNRQKDTSDG